MNIHLELQKQFQALAGQPEVGKLNRIPSVEERKLRLKLALEELAELAEAYGLISYWSELLTDEVADYDFDLKNTEEYNEIEVLDALIDIEVINNGSIITSGLQDVFDKNYHLVDTNNKTKFHTHVMNMMQTVNYYENLGIRTTIENIGFEGKAYYVIKNEAGKVLKPYNYEKVKLELI